MRNYTLNDLRGWHLAQCRLESPGLYSIAISRWNQTGFEMHVGFAKQAVITTAREFGYLTTNGRTLPTRKV